MNKALHIASGRWLIVLLMLGLPAVATDGKVADSEREAPLPPKTISIITNYKDVTAEFLAENVSEVIERQMSGLENLVQMRSDSFKSGNCQLQLVFSPQTDLDVALANVNQRLAIARPQLPPQTGKSYLFARKNEATSLTALALWSPDGRHDLVALSAQAEQFAKELRTLPALKGTFNYPIGSDHMEVYIAFDAAALAALELTNDEAVAAIERSDLGKIYSETPMFISLNRRTDQQRLAELSLKTDAAGLPIRLKDVARITPATSNKQQRVIYQGRSAMLISVPLPQGADPAKISQAADALLEKTRKNLPDGMLLDKAFDLTSNIDSHASGQKCPQLRIEIEMPEGTTAEQTDRAGLRAIEIVKQHADVKQSLVYRGARTVRDAHVYFQLEDKLLDDKKRAEVLDAVRQQFQQEKFAARWRVGDWTTFNRFYAPSDTQWMLVVGKQPLDLKTIRLQADKVAQALESDPHLTDVWLGSSGLTAAQTAIEVDRAAAKEAGFSAADLNQLVDRLETATNAEELVSQKVTNSAGAKVPLRDIGKLKRVDETQYIERYNGQTGVSIVFSWHADTSPDEAVRLARKKILELSLPEGISVEWPWIWQEKNEK